MTSLEKTVEITKKIIIGFTIGVLSIIFITISISIFGNLKNTYFPTPPPPPTVAFGKLPQIDFGNSGLNKNLNFSLQTVSGSLPVFPDREKIYKINSPLPNFLNLSNSQTIATQNNFNSNPVALSSTDYKWTNATPPATLIMNIVNNNLTYFYDFSSDQNVIQGINLGDSNTAIQTAINFFTNYEALPKEMGSNYSLSFFSLNNNSFTQVASLSQAQVIRVDFYQAKVNNLLIYYPKFPKSLIYAYVGGGANTSQVIKAHYSFKHISNISATYPLKTADQALAELKNNQGYISPGYAGSNNVVIRSISLGYFLNDKTDAYLMPIIVFKGDHNFFGFVSAVTNQWVNN